MFGRSPLPCHHQRQTLNTLPPELLQRIISHIPADGGRAGAALARVSRFVRACAAPFRCRSLSLSGRQVLAFAEFIERDPVARASVRHLFLADRGPRWSAAVDGRLAALGRPGAWLARARGTAADTPTLAPAEFEAALKRVLCAVAPTLRTLGLFMHHEPRFLLAPCALPALTDFTLCAHRHGYWWQHAAAPPGNAFPALNTLRLVAVESADVYALARLVPLCPALGAVRVTLAHMLFGFPLTLAHLVCAGEVLLRTVDPLPESVGALLVELPHVPERGRRPSDAKSMRNLAAGAGGRLAVASSGRKEGDLRQIRQEARAEWLRRADELEAGE